MPTVRYTGGSRYALRDGPTWEHGDVYDIDDLTADRLTDLDKFELVDESESEADAAADGEPDEMPAKMGETATTAEIIDRGECPWCSEYEGEAVGQHASSAHPDEWTEYKEG